MFFWFCKSRRLAFILLLLGSLSASRTFAQDKNEEALVIVSSAMDAYSNLEMDRAQELLTTALALKDSLEDATLAKIYTSLGVLAISGFSDNSEGQTHFTKAVCLDEKAKVDPLFSTPEIDLIFAQSTESATPERCEELGINVPPVEEIPQVQIEPCGAFEPIEAQRKAHELPFYVDINPSLKYQIDRLVLHYSYDSGKYQEAELSPKTGNGYGVLLECDAHELRISDPSEVTYYIEGLSADGSVLCGHGTDEYPLTLSMSESVSPLPDIGGMTPRECVQCAPWDDECRKGQAAAVRGDAKEGQSCTSDNDCIEGLLCDPELFVCGEKKAAPEKKEGIGPRVFYVEVGGGTGGGYVKKDLTIEKASIPDGQDGRIVTIDRDTSGGSWAGVPVRMALGYQITPKLAVEVSGRVDVYLVSNSTPVSCFDAAGGDLEFMRQHSEDCSLGFDGLGDPEAAEQGKIGIAMVPGEGRALMEKEYQVAWLVNARVRYRFLTKGALALSAFGGVGYGRIQYRVKERDGDESYFPMPGMVDIEVGPGLTYYFSDHVGLIADLPIDFLVGDGFAANVDLNVGIGVGF